MRRFLSVLPLLMLLSEICLAGPFGFEMGMTKEQIVTKLGKSHLKDVDGDIMTFDTAPAPHPDFTEYMLVISPTGGLVKLVAFTPHIQANDSGDQVKEKFSQLRGALKSKYGESKDFDYVKSSSIWHDPGDWMMSLLKEDRTLASYWTNETKGATPLPDKLTAIALTASAQSSHAAYISLGYEFEGFHAYATQKKEKQNSVF